MPQEGTRWRNSNRQTGFTTEIADPRSKTKTDREIFTPQSNRMKTQRLFVRLIQSSPSAEVRHVHFSPQVSIYLHSMEAPSMEAPIDCLMDWCCLSLILNDCANNDEPRAMATSLHEMTLTWFNQMSVSGHQTSHSFFITCI